MHQVESLEILTVVLVLGTASRGVGISLPIWDSGAFPNAADGFFFGLFFFFFGEGWGELMVIALWESSRPVVAGSFLEKASFSDRIVLATIGSSNPGESVKEEMAMILLSYL